MCVSAESGHDPHENTHEESRDDQDRPPAYLIREIESQCNPPQLRGILRDVDLETVLDADTLKEQNEVVVHERVALDLLHELDQSCNQCPAKIGSFEAVEVGGMS